MADIGIRLLDEDEWQLYREVRLAALKDAPESFVGRHDDEAARDEEFWHERMSRASRIVAERGGEPVGLVGLGLHDDPEEPEEAGAAEVFGLWTSPSVRGQRVARGLVSTAAEKAAEDGHRQLYYWAISDNASAVGFASSYGFRPTSKRRPVRVAEGQAEMDADEVAMVLPLAPDPTLTKNPHVP